VEVLPCLLEPGVQFRSKTLDLLELTGEASVMPRRSAGTSMHVIEGTRIKAPNPHHYRTLDIDAGEIGMLQFDLNGEPFDEAMGLDATVLEDATHGPCIEIVAVVHCRPQIT